MRMRDQKENQLIGWIDSAVIAAVFLLVYALVGVAHQWTGPYRSAVEIDLSLEALPRYAFLSLVRGFVAYGFSLIFSIAYGYWAAHSKSAERILVPLLDILQSIPVLGFLPGLVLAFVAVFPDSNIGLELACILMIFTGQVWNMTFSFYSSVKSVPEALRDVSQVYRLGRWQTLKRVELPFSMNGLVWNSMLSMAGGWFFLMVVESFTLGEKNFRLPGIGSYMAVAIEQKNAEAIWYGIAAMVLIIVLVDRVLWAPIVVWSQRFRTEKSAILGSDSFIASLFAGSGLVRKYFEIKEYFKNKETYERIEKAIEIPVHLISRYFFSVGRVTVILAFSVAMAYGAYYLYELVFKLNVTDWLSLLSSTLFTFLRVAAAVILGSLWTIPVGVFIGVNPIWTRRLQPVVQVIAAFPAPMLFPIIALFLLNCGIPFGLGSVVLMLVGSQWYILFNVISGANQIPGKFNDLASQFNVRGWQYWRSVILPSIFPSLVNGWITAAGGAWNASIVSEFVQYGNENFVAVGIGSAITKAAQTGNFPLLAAGIVTMITALVVLNHLLWSRLYHLASTRYRMDEV